MKLFSSTIRKSKKRSPNDWNHYNPLRYITSFSKAITGIWLALFIEVIIFSQLATVFSLGDSLSIQYINDTVKEIGVIICGAYFSSKCFENIAQGYEVWKERMLYRASSENDYNSQEFEECQTDNSDDDSIPID